jgi:hypothetical protein
VRRAKRFSARCAQSRWFVLDGTALRVDATPARSAVDLRRTYTQRRRERARTRHDMSGLSPEVQALKDEGNKNFRVAEYLKAAASYTKALKQAERDGSEQCVAAKRHHESSRDRVFSRAQTRSPLRVSPARLVSRDAKKNRCSPPDRSLRSSLSFRPPHHAGATSRPSTATGALRS